MTKRSQQRKQKKPQRGKGRRANQAGNNLITTRVIAKIPPKPRGLMNTKFYERVCSQINPFCAEALGAKIHDVSSAKTLTSCVRKIINITTNADGNAFYTFLPNLVLIGTVATIDGGGTITAFTGLGAVPNYVAYDENCKRYRTVSFGTRFVPTVAALENSGALIATELDFPPSTGTNYNSVNLSPVNIVRSIPGDPLFFVSRPTDIEYTDFKTIDSGEPAGQRTCVSIAITGAQPSTTIGIVEFVMNVELVPTANTVGGLFPTTAAPAVPLIQNVASNVQRDMPVLHSGTQESLTNMVMDEVKAVSSTVIAAGGNALRNSVLAALGAV